jgi:hypothetical protein
MGRGVKVLNNLARRIKRANKSKETLSAVHDDDLVNLLRSLGVLHEVESGKVKCKFCGIQVNLDNLQALIPDSGSVSYTCDKPSCVRLFFSYVEEMNGR